MSLKDSRLFDPDPNEKFMDNVEKREKRQKNYEDLDYVPEELTDEEKYYFGLRVLKETQWGSTDYIGYKQIEVELEPNGDFCNHSFYLYETPPSLKGLEVPEEVKVKKRIPPHEAVSYIKKSLETMKTLSQGSSLVQFWKPLITPHKKSDITVKDYAKFLLRVQGLRTESLARTEALNNINYTPRTSRGGHKFIPEREWFSDSVQQIKLEKLLSIVPPAELLTFANLIGRIVAGKDGETGIDGTIMTHTNRSMGILVGTTPGMGKSTIMDRLIHALNYCGYTMNPIINLDSGFSWGPVATADLAYLDDLTRKNQEKLVTHPIIKQIISNATISAEAKFESPIPVKPRATVISCSNTWDPRILYGMDPGVLSRVKFLYTRGHNDLRAFSKFINEPSDKDIRPRAFWSELAREAGIYNEDGTHEVVLSLYLIRLCFDFFMEVNGYQRVKEFGAESYVRKSPDKLEFTVKTLDWLHYYQCNPDHSQEIFKSLNFAKVVGLGQHGLTKSNLEEGVDCYGTIWNSTQISTSMNFLYRLLKDVSDDGPVNLVFKHHPILKDLGIKVKVGENLPVTETLEALVTKFPIPENDFFSPGLEKLLFNKYDDIRGFMKSLRYYIGICYVLQPQESPVKSHLESIIKLTQGYILDSLLSVDIESLRKSLSSTKKSSELGSSEIDALKILLGNLTDVDGFRITSDSVWTKEILKSAESEFYSNPNHCSIVQDYINTHRHPWEGWTRLLNHNYSPISTHGANSKSHTISDLDEVPF